MLAPHEEQKEMPLPIIYMLTQMITHLIPIPLKTAIRRLRKMGIGQFRVKDVLVVMSTEETERPVTTYLFQTLPLNIGAISLVTVKERNVYCGISGSVAKVACENLTYQVLNVLIPHISVRQTPYNQLIIHFSEKERLDTCAQTVISTKTNTAIIEIFRKNIKSELNLISTLIHELGHFFSSFNAEHGDEWYSNVCYLAAILHETHKQYLGRILPILDTSLTVAKYSG